MCTAHLTNTNGKECPHLHNVHLHRGSGAAKRETHRSLLLSGVLRTSRSCAYRLQSGAMITHKSTRGGPVHERRALNLFAAFKCTRLLSLASLAHAVSWCSTDGCHGWAAAIVLTLSMTLGPILIFKASTGARGGGW